MHAKAVLVFNNNMLDILFICWGKFPYDIEKTRVHWFEG